MGNKYERDLIKAMDEKALFDQIMPAIRAAIKAGGGADAILKKSEPIAAMALVKAAAEGDVRASSEILNRTQGKAIERSVNIYGDISRMNERDVDNQILQLLSKTGASTLIESTLGVSTKKRIQKRKPRKSTPLVIEAEIIESVSGAKPSAEAGTPAATEDEGTSH